MRDQTERRNFVSVYLLAGVATAPEFFTSCRETIEKLCEQSGWRANVEVLFPYGDNNRKLITQIREVMSDFPNRIEAFQFGGRQAALRIRSTFSGEPLILIGHSGGGAAAYQAVRILQKEQRLNEYRIVQLGSPKVPIHPEFSRYVCYIHAVDGQGKWKDPITRLGSWGGWSAGRYKLPRWNRYKYAPMRIEEIHLIGGHADYLRHEHPFVDGEQMSNLDKTLRRVWQWLQDSMFLQTVID